MRPTVLTVRSTDRVEIVACNAMDETVALLSGRDWWTDETQPRTDKPVRFVPFNGWSGIVRGDGGTFLMFRCVTFPR